MVYQPKKSIKLKDVMLIHLAKETRYDAHWVHKDPLAKQVDSDKATLNRWVGECMK